MRSPSPSGGGLIETVVAAFAAFTRAGLHPLRGVASLKPGGHTLPPRPPRRLHPLRGVASLKRAGPEATDSQVDRSPSPSGGGLIETSFGDLLGSLASRLHPLRGVASLKQTPQLLRRRYRPRRSPSPSGGGLIETLPPRRNPGRPQKSPSPSGGGLIETSEASLEESTGQVSIPFGGWPH